MNAGRGLWLIFNDGWSLNIVIVNDDWYLIMVNC